MRLSYVTFLSLCMIGVGYLARVTQTILLSHEQAGTPLPQIQTAPDGGRIYELNEVEGNRQNLDDHVICVVGAVCIGPGEQPFLIPDDDSSLQNNPIGKGRYKLSLPDWRFRDLTKNGVFPRCAIKGRFGKLDDNLGFDGLSPIESVSWRANLPKRQGAP
jgi:hypothetical protein